MVFQLLLGFKNVMLLACFRLNKRSKIETANFQVWGFHYKWTHVLQIGQRNGCHKFEHTYSLTEQMFVVLYDTTNVCVM